MKRIKWSAGSPVSSAVSPAATYFAAALMTIAGEYKEGTYLALSSSN